MLDGRRNRHIHQIVALRKCEITDAGDSIRNGNNADILIAGAVKRRTGNGCHALFDADLLDLLGDAVPGLNLVADAVFVLTVVLHVAGTADDEHTVIGQRPVQAFAAGTAGRCDIRTDGCGRSGSRCSFRRGSVHRNRCRTDERTVAGKCRGSKAGDQAFRLFHLLLIPLYSFSF